MAQLSDLARRMFRMRTERTRARPGPIPRMGRYIQLDNRLRMRVTGNPSAEFWAWLTLIGWREIRHVRDRRNYIDLPERSFMELFRRDPQRRETLYDRLVEITTH